jgi:hypothetical protein
MIGVRSRTFFQHGFIAAGYRQLAASGSSNTRHPDLHIALAAAAIATGRFRRQRHMVCRRRKSSTAAIGNDYACDVSDLAAD